MTTQEYIDKLKNLMSNFDKILLQKMVSSKINYDLAEMIKRRVMKGENMEGGSFNPYSTKPMLTNGTTEQSKSIWNSVASSKAKRKELIWVTINGHHLFILTGGYAEMRKLTGLQTDHKDFSFTSKMWKDFGVNKEDNPGSGGVSSTIGIKNLDSLSQKKVDGNSAREKMSIIGASKEEISTYNKKVNTLVGDMICFKD